MRFLVVALLAFGPVAALAQPTIEPIVAVSQLGWGWYHAVDQSGNLFRTQPAIGGGLEWESFGNIPAMAGRTESSPFVALSNWYINGINGCAA